MQGGFQQLFETVYVQYLYERRDFDLTGNVDPGVEHLVVFNSPDDLLKNPSNSVAVGLDWDWPDIRGNGFPD